ncbi:activator of the mannose operon, transcriptional antiterminator [Marininema mesophilum]|uniref:Activator of the mannose operon, transcriptional antiterminator n=1 Tax=Marininema mesophilum TaxID=1048340 RepID=A0A1H2V8L9_9BACL|nr:PRD domain-containing protein [Marininema mesophilum]SDW64610.1 activator of the mannose operon, transcriptional antiterminator [Marininema mesophilum]
MNSRRIQLIQHLNHANEPVSVRFIAEEIGCSEKTVRNDLHMVRQYLQGKGLTLTMRPGVGVYLTGSTMDKERVLLELKGADSHDLEKCDRRGRKLRLTHLLLDEDNPLTLAFLAKKLYISKGSVHADLNRIEPWFLKHGLTIVRKPNVGIRVEGEEKARRLAMSHLMREEVVMEEGLPTREELGHMKDEIYHLERKFTLTYTEEGVANLAIHLSVAMRRVRQYQQVDMMKDELAFLQEQKEYRYGEYLARRIEKRYALHLPESEVGYITIHLLSAKLRQSSKERDFSTVQERVDADAWELATTMVNRLSEVLDQPLKLDESLLTGLALHLQSALYRLRYGLGLDNPLLAEIEQNYRFLYEMILSLLLEWEQERGVRFSAAEAGFLTLHFQAALERILRMTKRWRVLIICASGMGTSQLIQAKLERLFPEIEVVDTIASHELNCVWSRGCADFVISTVPLNQVEGRPIIQVSPFLTREEHERLRGFLDGYPLINSGGLPSPLGELLSEERIFLQIEMTERDELLRVLADSLDHAGIVDKEYVDSVLKREQLSSTTIGVGIAIPHGALRHIQRSGIAVATLKNPLDWGGEPVDIIFLLALHPEEGERTQRIFRELVDLTGDPVLLEKLRGLRDSYVWLEQLKRKNDER